MDIYDIYWKKRLIGKLRFEKNQYSYMPNRNYLTELRRKVPGMGSVNDASLPRFLRLTEPSASGEGHPLLEERIRLAKQHGIDDVIRCATDFLVIVKTNHD